MSAICRITESSVSTYRVLTKGAPEVLKKFMTNLPKDYDEQYLHYVKDGARVLVLA
jgi:cation-transporting ATPase 13A1